MGRKKLPKGQKKVNITIRIKEELVDKLKSIDNYTAFIEKLLEEALK